MTKNARKAKPMTEYEAAEREERDAYRAANEAEVLHDERYAGYTDHDAYLYEPDDIESAKARETADRQARRRKIAKAKEEAAAPGCQPLATVRPSDWTDDDVPKREWYWEGLFPYRQVSILTAEGGTGKSLLGAQVATASALEVREVFGRRLMPGPVIYLGAEDDEDEFKRRLHDIARGYGVKRSEIEDFHLIPLAGEDAILSEPNREGVMIPTEKWHRLIETVREVQPVAVYLDTAADLFGGDEIKRAQSRQFVGMLRHMAMSYDCALILLYHPSQSGVDSGTGKSGSSAWFNSVRSSVFMTREKDDKTGDLRRLKNTKTNYGKFGDGVLVKWQKGMFALVDPDAPPSPEEKKHREDAKLEFMSRFIEHTSSASSSRLSEGTNGKYSAVKTLWKAKRNSEFDLKEFEQALKDLIDDGKLEFARHRVNGRDETNLILKASPRRQYGQDH